MKSLNDNYFDCPFCGIKNVMYSTLARQGEQIKLAVGKHQVIQHVVAKCTNTECERISYFIVLTRFYLMQNGWQDIDSQILFQYPTAETELPEYIPAKIRRYFREATLAFGFGLNDSASVMCRKTIYELCDQKSATGNDYKEKIGNLGLDKRITDPLINIKNIGDESAHSDGWDKATIEKAIEALKIIIELIYVSEERIKNFSKHYTKENQKRKSEAKTTVDLSPSG